MYVRACAHVKQMAEESESFPANDHCCCVAAIAVIPSVSFSNLFSFILFLLLYFVTMTDSIFAVRCALP